MSSRCSSRSSAMSVKSASSKDNPPNLSDELRPPGTRRKKLSSTMSVKSASSKDNPPNLNNELGTPDARSKKLRLREMHSRHSSMISVKSASSKDNPPNLSHELGPPGTRLLRQPDVLQHGDFLSVSGFNDVSRVRLCSSAAPWMRRSVLSVGLQQVLEGHKQSVRRRYERVAEGSDAAGGGTLLSSIFTELYITEGNSEEPQREHELTQLEAASKSDSLHSAPIRCHDIFKASPKRPTRSIRVVLSSGVAGAGKTFSVLKFALDWAEGRENWDVDVLVVLSFRELHLIRDQPYSLLGLLHVFHPSLQTLSAEQLAVCRLLFILDGLDESRLSLDFTGSKLVSEVTHETSVGLLLTNLIRGNLLPSARVWVTSQPAAANRIPPVYVDRLTEVRGFKNAQKEEFFRRRFGEGELCSRITSHIKSSRSLHVMCGIPVFCWITATVLEHMLSSQQGGELPTTLTDMYSYFVLVQSCRKKLKYHEGAGMSPQQLMEADWELLLKLGRLAFEHLDRGNIMFYREDLQWCGLDETEASVCSGVFTQIFKRESVIFQKPIYSFVHLSVQEFLAAVYMFHCFTNQRSTVLESFLGEDYKHAMKKVPLSLEDFLHCIMQDSLRRQNGQRDLFVRFLHGLSLPSNQSLLGDLLGHPENGPETVQRVIDNLKGMKHSGLCPERSINIFHCLIEMRDLSVHQQVQQFLQSQHGSEELSEIQCSALAYVLQMSHQVLEELNLQNYRTSTEGKRRLIPAVKNCRKARLHGCFLAEAHCQVLSSALKSDPSHLTHLDLSLNPLNNSVVKLLCAGLQSPNCQLEDLRLERCGLTELGLCFVISALRSNPLLLRHLRHLDLSYNTLLPVESKRQPGLQHLCGLLQSPHCNLQTLKLNGCGLAHDACSAVASALKSSPSHLMELHLSDNQLREADVQELAELVRSPSCSLRTIRWRPMD